VFTGAVSVMLLMYTVFTGAVSVMLLMLQHGQTPAQTGKHIRCKPSFLQTVLKEIVLAGKSMELLTSLGQRVDILRGTRLPVRLLFNK